LLDESRGELVEIGHSGIVPLESARVGWAYGM